MPHRKPFTLPDSAREFIDTLRPVYKPGTCGVYAVDLRGLHAWLASQNLSLGELDRSVMERWIKSLADRGLAPSTRCARICRARIYFTWLAEHERIVADPDDLLRSSDLPKLPTYLPRPFSVEADRELQRRFRRIGTVYGQALFLMRRSGVRIGELVHLEPGCLEQDLHNNIFLKVPLGKLDNERLVPLDDEAQEVAQSLQHLCSADAPFLVSPHISRSRVRQLLYATLKDAAAGLDIPGPVVSHRLRHSYATELLNAGMSLLGIMKLLGHRRIGMTMRYAAITQRTVVKDYFAALAKTSSRYPSPVTSSLDEPDPDRMLRDVISCVRNRAGGATAHRLISRIHKLRHDIAHLPVPARP